MIERKLQLTLLVFATCSQTGSEVNESTAYFNYERDINPTLEAYNLSLPFLKTFTVNIMYGGFTITLRDVYEQFILIELHGNLNSRSTEIKEMKYQGLLEMDEQEKFVVWHYNNFDIVLKEGDYFFFVLHPVEASGRSLRLQPGCFHVRKKFM